MRAFLRGVVMCLLAGSLSAAPEENGHRFVAVRAGKWNVGGEHAANPRRTVRLAAFRIADAETTNAQFARFVKATGYRTDAERQGFGMVSREGMMDWAWEKVRGACWRRPSGAGGSRAEDLPEHPVTQISARDAAAYCRWLGGRLPTLEEWEVAARAGSPARYPWGEAFEARRANVWNGETHRRNSCEDGFLYTAPGRSYSPNAWGLYDVIGNVFEYCAGLPATYSPGEAKRLTAARGGSWWCSRGTCQFYNVVDVGVMDRRASFANQGFRVVAE